MVREQDLLLVQASQLVKAPTAELTHRIETLIGRNRELEKALEAEQARKTANSADALADQAIPAGAFRILAARLDAPDMDQLRLAADRIRDKIAPAVILLAAAIDGKVSLVAMASPEAVKAGANAGTLVREAAKITGGGGGGRPDMAQAGGKDVTAIDAALAKVVEIARQQLGA
jgi:alanyl-tRNA synthetase